MSILILNPTGIFKGFYQGVSATRNPDYMKVSLHLETEAHVPSSESLVISSKDTELFARLKQLEVGKPYQFFLSVSLQNPRVDANTGKSYNARVQYKLLKVL